MNISRRLFLKATAAVAALPLLPIPSPVKRYLSFGQDGSMLLFDHDVDINKPLPTDWLAVVPLKFSDDGMHYSGKSLAIKSGLAKICVQVAHDGTPICSLVIGEDMQISNQHVYSESVIHIDGSLWKWI